MFSNIRFLTPFHPFMDTNLSWKPSFVWKLNFRCKSQPIPNLDLLTELNTFLWFYRVPQLKIEANRSWLDIKDRLNRLLLYTYRYILMYNEQNWQKKWAHETKQREWFSKKIRTHDDIVYWRNIKTKLELTQILILKNFQILNWIFPPNYVD